MTVARVAVAALAALIVLAAAAAAQSFNRADRDRDGVVTFEEARRVMPRLSEVHFGKCDRDRDGRLTPADYNCLLGIYDALYRLRR